MTAPRRVTPALHDAEKVPLLDLLDDCLLPAAAMLDGALAQNLAAVPAGRACL